MWQSQEQESIIGPVAIEQAAQIAGFHINWDNHSVSIDGDPKIMLDELIDQYKKLFGQIAVQVSKEAVAAILTKLPSEQQPKSLQ